VSSGSSSVFSGVFIAGEVDGVGDKWSGDTRMVTVKTLLEAFGLDPRSSCFTDEALLFW
jgi:hypothetical protein